jgi:hypothetical protein
MSAEACGCDVEAGWICLRHSAALAVWKPAVVPLPTRARFEALVEEADAEQREAVPWYRRRPELYRFRHVAPEWERLTRIAGKLEIPQWLAEDAAHVLQVARQCPRDEACDRLAHALEQLARREQQYVRLYFRR